MSTAIQIGLAERLRISGREWGIVAEILAAHLAGRTVWAFGSRATGKRVKRFSDLDLAVAGKLGSRERADLNEAFDEALINFKVDVVEKDLVDAEFWERIEKEFVVLQGGVER